MYVEIGGFSLNPRYNLYKFQKMLFFVKNLRVLDVSFLRFVLFPFSYTSHLHLPLHIRHSERIQSTFRIIRIGINRTSHNSWNFFYWKAFFWRNCMWGAAWQVQIEFVIVVGVALHTSHLHSTTGVYILAKNAAGVLYLWQCFSTGVPPIFFPSIYYPFCLQLVK